MLGCMKILACWPYPMKLCVSYITKLVLSIEVTQRASAAGLMVYIQAEGRDARRLELLNSSVIFNFGQSGRRFFFIYIECIKSLLHVSTCSELLKT